MSSNLPPGVSENIFGAPYNDEEFEFSILVTFAGCVQGPLSQEEYDNEVADIKKECMEQLLKLDFVEHIREDFHE